MKKKKPSNGYIIGVIIIVLMFMSYNGQNLSTLYNANYNGNVNQTASAAALISVLINIVTIGIVPLLIKLINKDFYKKNVIAIYIINGIAWIIISIPLYNLIDSNANAGIGLLGSIIFSIAIYNLLRGKESYKKNSISYEKKEQLKNTFKCSDCGAVCYEGDKYCKNCKAIFDDEIDNDKKKSNTKTRSTNSKDKFKCSECGAICYEGDKYCKNCKAIFDDEPENNKEKKKNNDSNVDQKYSDLIKLKELLDKEIISKEEFEKEKKKILD